MKNQLRLFLIVVVLCGLTTPLKATYYQETFFPIGLTGINPTGWASNNCPYGNLPPDKHWSWDTIPRSEQKLIFDLGINCIGCQDAKG